MNKRILLFSILLILLIPLVFADDLTLSTNQTEYYFKTGENAIVILHSDNTYDHQIDGLLSYTITQEIHQGNLQYSSSNTQSTSFSFAKGELDNSLSFGTSDTPLTLNVDLKFSYTEDGAREVPINNIKIYFVNEDSQKNNQQNKASSSSQEVQTQQQQNTPLSQQMQQMMNQMKGQQQQQKESQNPQQKLQNNQMSQDSSALKQQMEKQIEEQQKMKQEFQKQLAQNNDFQKEHQDLLNKGYNLTSANVNPSTNKTGSFDLNYEKSNGEKASLKGNMQDGKMQNIKKNTPESRQQALDKLQEDKEFQKYQNQLQKQGFQQNNTQFSQEINKTNIQMNYINKNNETASISADIINNTVKNIKVINNTRKKRNNYFWIILIILVAGITGFLIYKKRFNKKKIEIHEKQKIEEKLFDYKKESLLVLNKAKKLFEKEKYKDAYMFASQALRLFLSYENNLKKEVTNDEIINYLKKHKQSYKNVKDCFDLCSLVEFAKYKANKKDFSKIIDFAEKVIK